ncbi:NAD(P)-dependent oxidoreductase [Amycolatopsis sp. A133]|uniref:NAD-dependent epimerase/dehydratase family protein n=1 Tax=Amycolatopsis sp. A133 TaxID=3064472 RepID=UPI0027F5C02A|nr:NAD(P)-dependent oxidoreductase [Amycolatopsis sp. A133]MDQ7803461.1 NAD(P)-dependent oxidoreductase [Amycolatopsis sp. A133]
MRFLVTGGAGFVGAATARHLLAAGHDVVTFDRTPADHTGHEHVVADIRDSGAIERALSGGQVDGVLHAAAFPSVASCDRDPVGAFDVNVTGTARVVTAAARHGVRRVVTVSSEEVYGDFPGEVAAEDDRALPTSVYGATKLAAEAAGRTIGRVTGVEHVAVRLSWAYGPGYPRQRAPRSMILDALAGTTTSLAGGADHALDLTYIDDATDAFRRLLEAPSLAHDVYNLASGVAYSPVDIAGAVRAVRPDWDFAIGPGPLTTEDGTPLPAKGALVLDRIRELGYVPSVPLAVGVQREYEAIANGGGR